MEHAGLFLHMTLLAIGALLPIVDPLAGAPLYLSLTTDLRAEERAAMAQYVAWNSFVLLLASMFVGAYVLDFFGLSVPAVQVAGGIVVATMGWELLNKPETNEAASRASAVEEAAAEKLRTRAFYPLTMPLTVGPGSISVAITLGANPSPDVRALLITGAGHAMGALVVALAVYFCYRYAHVIVAKLGETGRSVVTRLSAFLLMCIGVQIAWNGVSALLGEIVR